MEVDLLSDDVTEKRFEEFRVLGQMQSENWTVDEGANQFQDGLGHFRAGCEFQNMSEC
jgi:hypothetical protein